MMQPEVQTAYFKPISTQGNHAFNIHTNPLTKAFFSFINSVLCWRTRVLNMCSNFTDKRCFYVWKSLPNFYISCTCCMRALLSFPLWEIRLLVGYWRRNRYCRKRRKREKCSPQQQRGVSLMAGGGRKSQDLMCTVKLSNSPRHTSDRTVGVRCTAILHAGVGVVIPLQKIYHSTCYTVIVSWEAFYNAKQFHTLKNTVISLTQT